MSRGLLIIRWPAAVAAMVLATLPLVACPDAARATHATEPAPVTCDADEVTVVVDPNELGGSTRVVCVRREGAASQLFDAAGFRLTAANAPGMQGYVCKVNGRPEDGRCTRGDAYWSLWWAAAGQDSWAYATLGVESLELAAGDRLAFAWHEGSGSAEPPGLELSSDDATAGDDVVEGAGPTETAQDAGGQDGPARWLVAVGAVGVLGLAAVVPLRRRRQQ